MAVFHGISDLKLMWLQGSVALSWNQHSGDYPNIITALWLVLSRMIITAAWHPRNHQLLLAIPALTFQNSRGNVLEGAADSRVHVQPGWWAHSSSRCTHLRGLELIWEVSLSQGWHLRPEMATEVWAGVTQNTFLLPFEPRATRPQLSKRQSSNGPKAVMD